MQAVTEKRMTIQISDKIDFKTKIVTRDKEKYFIMIKGSIYWKDTAINICALHNRSPKYISKT